MSATHTMIDGELVELTVDEKTSIEADWAAAAAVKAQQDADRASAPPPRDIEAELDAAVARADRLEAALKTKTVIADEDIVAR